MSDVKRYTVLLPDEIDASMHRCKVVLASDHEREVAALRATIKKYGVHLAGCAYGEHPHDWPQPDCDCGLSDNQSSTLKG